MPATTSSDLPRSATRSLEVPPAELKARFDLDGFVSVGRVLDPAVLFSLSQRVDEICAGDSRVPEKNIRFHRGMDAGARTGAARRDAVWQVLDAHATDDVVAGVCAAPAITAIAALVLGGSCRVATSQIITKPAFHGSMLPWHQDSSYWGNGKVVTCWLAIDDATPANGCMRMIPGSHLRGQRPFTKRSFPGADVDLLETDGVDESTQLYVPVPAGCACFHAQGTLHASSENTTPNRRRAIAITYVLEVLEMLEGL